MSMRMRVAMHKKSLPLISEDFELHEPMIAGLFARVLILRKENVGFLCEKSDAEFGYEWLPGKQSCT